MVDRADEKQSARGSRAGTRRTPAVLAAIAEHQAHIAAARDSWCARGAVVGRGRGGSADNRQLAAVFSAAHHAMAQGRAAVTAMYALAGASSLYTSSPLERSHRDMHAMAAHVIAQPMWLKTPGASPRAQTHQPFVPGVPAQLYTSFPPPPQRNRSSTRNRVSTPPPQKMSHPHMAIIYRVTPRPDTITIPGPSQSEIHPAPPPLTPIPPQPPRRTPTSHPPPMGLPELTDRKRDCRSSRRCASGSPSTAARCRRDSRAHRARWACGHR